MREKNLKKNMWGCVCSCTRTHKVTSLVSDSGLQPTRLYGLLQARILEWLPCPLPGDLADPGIRPASLTSNLHWQTGSLPLVQPGKLGGQEAPICVLHVCVCKLNHFVLHLKQFKSTICQ